MKRHDSEAWRKSRYSGNGGCVEVGQAAGDVAVRDTTNREGAELRFSARAWRRLVSDLKAADPSLGRPHANVHKRAPVRI